MSTFVLIHASCHGGWYWKKLAPILRKSRHEVYTPTLTGLGERSHLVSKNVNLNTNIENALKFRTLSIYQKFAWKSDHLMDVNYRTY